MFKSLTRQNLDKIVQLEIKGVFGRLKDKNIELDIPADTIEFLITKGFDPIYGARPLKRTLQRYLEDPLSEYIISGQVKDGQKIKAVLKGDTVIFEPC